MTSSVFREQLVTVTERTPTLVRYTLTAAEAVQTMALADQCAARYGTAASADFHANASVIAAELPRRLRATVNHARLYDRLHVLLITGNRVDDDLLEGTPAHWSGGDTPGSRAYSFLLVLYASLLGDVVGWATQQDGRLVTDVLPIAGHEDSLVSSCSEQELGWHTEDAFSPSRADYVGLYCLRSPEVIPTTVAAVDLGRLPGRIVDVLSQQRFIILPDSSHDPANNTGQSLTDQEAFERLARRHRQPPRVAVLSGAPEALVLRVDRDFTIAEDDDAEATAALRRLVEHLDGNLYDLVLHPGDVGFIDNRNVVHGRRAFRPRHDGTDRWLKRVNIVSDLRRTRPERGTAASRVIG